MISVCSICLLSSFFFTSLGYSLPVFLSIHILVFSSVSIFYWILQSLYFRISMTATYSIFQGSNLITGLFLRKNLYLTSWSQMKKNCLIDVLIITNSNSFQDFNLSCATECMGANKIILTAQPYMVDPLIL